MNKLDIDYKQKYLKYKKKYLNLKEDVSGGMNMLNNWKQKRAKNKAKEKKLKENLDNLDNFLKKIDKIWSIGTETENFVKKKFKKSNNYKILKKETIKLIEEIFEMKFDDFLLLLYKINNPSSYHITKSLTQKISEDYEENLNKFKSDNNPTSKIYENYKNEINYILEYLKNKINTYIKKEFENYYEEDNLNYDWNFLNLPIYKIIGNEELNKLGTEDTYPTIYSLGYLYIFDKIQNFKDESLKMNKDIKQIKLLKLFFIFEIISVFRGYYKFRDDNLTNKYGQFDYLTFKKDFIDKKQTEFDNNIDLQIKLKNK